VNALRRGPHSMCGYRLGVANRSHGPGEARTCSVLAGIDPVGPRKTRTRASWRPTTVAGSTGKFRSPGGHLTAQSREIA